MTKLIQQYQQIKIKYKDAILLFRVGDFYETFNEDAKIVSEVTGITLVESETDEHFKASVSLPVHSLDNALRKLVRKGHKVAICEQLEDPKLTKGIPRRGVTDLL
jgi:DNA mismatch repair protein MutS